MSKTVLICVHTNTWFVELFRFAKLLKPIQEYNPVFLFSNPYPHYLDDAVKCSQEKLMALNSSGAEINFSPLKKGESERVNPAGIRGQLTRLSIHSSSKNSIKSKLSQAIFSPKRENFITRLLQQIFLFKIRYVLINKILEIHKPSIVVLGGDMVGYDTSVYIKLAHRKNIPVLIVPSTMSNGLEQAEAYYHNPDHSLGRWINRLAANLHPGWVLKHRGRKLLRVPGERVLLMELLGLAPPLPWVFNSGYADAIAIESKQMKQYYLDCGIQEKQLRLVGSLADDLMVNMIKNRNQYRAEVCKEFGLKNNKPILLSALPPDFLYMPGGRPECDFNTYPELVRFWVRSIAIAEEYHVFVCLHPSATYETFKYIENWGVKIVKRNTAELVPLCDIYVASVSSTIRWAIACGIPVINYDVYRYRYTDYLGIEGVLIVEEQNDFKNSIKTLVKDNNFYNQIMKAQGSIAGNWGMFDGKVGKRMISLIDELSGRKEFF
jgi:hypothetical protein